MLQEAESYSVPGHYIDGSRRLLDQTEFSQGSRARELVELVEEQVLLEGIISETPPDGDVVVYIGGENRPVSLRPFGVILCQYGIPSQASGTICVIGHAGALRAADNYVIPGSEHWQQSKFEAWPGDWGYECSHGGDPPGPLDCVCYADSYLLP